MTNYPDAMNWNAYDRTIGSYQSDAEAIWEAHAHHINDIITRAYNEWPLNGAQRRDMIRNAICKAQDALDNFVWRSVRDTYELNVAFSLLIEADLEGNIDGVRERAGDYMHVYSQAIERAAV